MEMSFVVLTAQVTGSKPAVDHHLARRLRVVKIAGNDTRPAHPYLPDAFEIRVSDLHFDVRQR